MSGTEVVCSVCHEAHGSTNTALIRTTLAPPSVEDTVAVPGNDRWLCYACHPGGLATYSGGLTYEASTHGTSEATVAITAEWAERYPAGSAETSRKAGECQVCHAATGRDDGTGKPIGSCRTRSARRCATAATNGAPPSQATSPRSTRRPPPTCPRSSRPTARRPRPGSSRSCRSTRASRARAGLPSPRQAIEGTVGAVVAGDIDGDPGAEAEAIVARPGSVRGRRSAPVRARGVHEDLGETARRSVPRRHWRRASTDLGDARKSSPRRTAWFGVYRWNGATLTFVPSTATTLSGTISGLTTGDVHGRARDEIVVTTYGPEPVYVIDGGLARSPWAVPPADPALPMGPSVGDLDAVADAKGEIAVAFPAKSCRRRWPAPLRPEV